MLEKARTFKGGYLFPKFNGSLYSKLEEAAFPSEVIIPLKQGFGEEVAASVEVGDKVKAGQIIGRDDESISTPVQATISGTVRRIAKIKYLGKEVAAVFIASNGRRDWEKIKRPFSDFSAAAPSDIRKLLYLVGVTSLGKTGIPTEYNTSPISPDKVEHVLVHTINSEPFSLPNSILLKDKVQNLITGLRVLRSCFPNSSTHLCINSEDRAIIDQIVAAAEKIDWLRIHPLRPKYPQEYEEVLVETVLGIKVTDGGIAADAGALVLDAQAVLHIYEAVVEGKPLIERVVALGGSGYKNNIAVKVRVGTRLEEIVKLRLRDDVESRIVVDSAITGLQQNDLSVPVGRTAWSVLALEENRKRVFLAFLRPGIDYDSKSRSFLSLLSPGRPRRSDTNTSGELRPCIACIYCDDVCPRDLMPHLLSKMVTHDLLDEAERIRIFGCIECGLCSYVCPSKIPLMSDIQMGKQKIREEAKKAVAYD